jgi:hypothetical protein
MPMERMTGMVQRTISLCALGTVCLLLFGRCGPSPRTLGVSAPSPATSQTSRVGQMPTEPPDIDKNSHAGKEPAASSFAGDECCALQLERIREAIKYLDLDNDPDSDFYAIPSRKQFNQYFNGHVPACPRSSVQRSHSGREDYYLCDEGPEPIDRDNPLPGRNVLAYERAGNHDGYRHVLMERCVWVVSEAQWRKMREDPSYVPDCTHLHDKPGLIDRVLLSKPGKGESEKGGKGGSSCPERLQNVDQPPVRSEEDVDSR